MKLCSFLLVSLIFEYVYADYNADIGCCIHKADKEPEVICGSDFQVYTSRLDFKLAKCLDKIGLSELPFHVCASNENFVGEGNQLEDIGMRFLDSPPIRQQNKLNPSNNQIILNNPVSHDHNHYNRQRGMHHERQPNAHRYYGQHSRRNSYPLRHSDDNRSYRQLPSMKFHYNTDRPKYHVKPHQFSQNINNQIPYTSQQFPFRGEQYSNLPYLKPFDSRNEFQQTIPQTIFSPPILYSNIIPRRVEENMENLSSNKTRNSTCDEKSTSKVQTENEIKAKNGRAVDEGPKDSSKSKLLKPKQKTPSEKSAKKSNNPNKMKSENEGELRSLNLDPENQNEIDDAESSQQIVAERSNLKMPQNTKISDQKSKKIQQKSDKNKTDKIKDDKINDALIPKADDKNESSTYNQNREKFQELEDKEATSGKPEVTDEVIQEISNNEGNPTTAKSII